MSPLQRLANVFLTVTAVVGFACQPANDHTKNIATTPSEATGAPIVVSSVKTRLSVALLPKRIMIVRSYSPETRVAFDRRAATWFVADETSQRFVRLLDGTPPFEIKVAGLDGMPPFEIKAANRVSVTDLAFDSQGTLWFAISPVNKPWGVGYGFLDPAGEQHLTTIPGTAGQVPAQIAITSNGGLWIATKIDYEILYVGRNSSTKPIAVEAFQFGLDSEGRAWFLNEQGLGYALKSGVVRYLTLAPPNQLLLSNRRFGGLSVANDDSIWFTFSNPPTVAHLDPYGKLRLYEVPIRSAYPPLVAACDHNRAWVSAQVDENWIGLLRSGGNVSRFSMPASVADVDNLVSKSSCDTIGLTAYVAQPNGERKKRVILISI